MRLFEHEAKELLAKHAIRVPKSILHRDRYPAPWVPCYVKAQMLGDPAQHGGVILCSTMVEAQQAIDKLFDSTIEQEHITHLLVEEYLPSNEHFAIRFFHDEAAGSPILMLSKSGSSAMKRLQDYDHGGNGLHMNTLPHFTEREAHEILEHAHLPVDLANIAVKLWHVFTSEDCTVLDAYSIIIGERGPVLLDCHIELDEAAHPKHPEWHYAGRLPAHPLRRV